MKHWIQIYSAKKFQKYDYGTERENKKHYGTGKPPEYNLEKLYSIPSLMTISDADPFSNPQDVLEFINNIEDKNIVNLLSLSNYNHIDYFWADSAIKDIFPKVIDFLE